MPVAFKVVLELGRNGKMVWFKLPHVTFLPTQLFREVRPKERYRKVHFSPRRLVSHLSFPLHCQCDIWRKVILQNGPEPPPPPRSVWVCSNKQVWKEEAYELSVSQCRVRPHCCRTQTWFHLVTHNWFSSVGLTDAIFTNSLKHRQRDQYFIYVGGTE